MFVFRARKEEEIVQQEKKTGGKDHTNKENDTKRQKQKAPCQLKIQYTPGGVKNLSRRRDNISTDPMLVSSSWKASLYGLVGSRMADESTRTP